jgi:hypothetical protein
MTLIPAAVAGGASCSAEISPDPGWVGAVVTFSGSGLEPNVHYQVRIGGGAIIDLFANPDGTFSYQYTIPAIWDSGQDSVGVTEWYIFTFGGCKPMGETAQPYTVLASQPTSTTAATTTTAAATTTVAATTTTAGVTTTSTVAGATTTAAADSTTTSVAGTTTTAAASDDGGGTSPIVIALLALVVAALVFVGLAIMRTRRG